MFWVFESILSEMIVSSILLFRLRMRLTAMPTLSHLYRQEQSGPLLQLSLRLWLPNECQLLQVECTSYRWVSILARIISIWSSSCNRCSFISTSDRLDTYCLEWGRSHPCRRNRMLKSCTLDIVEADLRIWCRYCHRRWGSSHQGKPNIDFLPCRSSN